MDAGDAVEGAAAARRVGEPGIARAHDVVHGGAHGVVRIAVGRRFVDAGAQLVLGMIGAHADIVGAALCLRMRGANLLPGSACTSCGMRDRVLAFGVLLQLAGVDSRKMATSTGRSSRSVSSIWKKTSLGRGASNSKRYQ